MSLIAFRVIRKSALGPHELVAENLVLTGLGVLLTSA